MDALILARWEFAVTAGVHFLMVATTLGLAPVVAALQTAVWRAGRAPARGSAPVLEAARDRILRLYLLNYGIGIVTGLVMELQMAVNWTGAGSALYDPIAALLGVETLAAFFVESTLLGLFLASGGTFSQGVRTLLLWGVAGTAWLSAWVVVSANAYLHRPTGVSMVDGRASFTDPWAVLTQAAAVVASIHIVGAAGLVAAFWVAAAGAALVLRQGADDPVGRLLLRVGIWIGAVTAPVNVASGVVQFSAARADAKFTNYGWHGGLLALMLLIGALILLITWLLWVPLLLRGRVFRTRFALRILGGGVWIPLLACILGWISREEARQPWFIVGRVRVADAVSAPEGPALALTAFGFIAVGVCAAVLAWVLMGREIRRPLRQGTEVVS
ncbi:MAG: cytochrome ubiquinol oxidase subunit I [Austwickia sp.]|nr:cytochrome ubiquinol oxidase subunit I [Austwickia sp.]